jgi:hypothetical protein
MGVEMSRPKGIKNKIRQIPAEQFSYTTAQRIDLVADLIVEKIIEDQHNGRHILTILETTHAPAATRQGA